MLKKSIKTIRKICVALIILYSFNLIVSNIDIYIPINIITTGAISVLGMPGLLSLVAMFFVLK